MEKLSLPIIKGEIPAAKVLLMDAYLKFVYLNLRYTFNGKAINEWRKVFSVKVPFLIKS